MLPERNREMNMASKKLQQPIPQINAAAMKLPTIAERFQQLDFDEAVFCFGEIKAIMKQRVQAKYKETEDRLAMLKSFCGENNI